MIFHTLPSNWQDLQNKVAVIFKDMDFDVQVSKKIRLARGEKEIDVYAKETGFQPNNLLLTECKFWNKKVNQEIVHSFRTVMLDSGANIGFIVSKVGFQSGAITAIENTNIKLFTWNELQKFFFERWSKSIENKLWIYSQRLGDSADYISIHSHPNKDFIQRYSVVQILAGRFCPFLSTEYLSKITFPLTWTIPKMYKNDKSSFTISSAREYYEIIKKLIDEGVSRI